jgi:hypothetical protein
MCRVARARRSGPGDHDGDGSGLCSIIWSDGIALCSIIWSDGIALWSIISPDGAADAAGPVQAATAPLMAIAAMSAIRDARAGCAGMSTSRQGGKRSRSNLPGLDDDRVTVR